VKKYNRNILFLLIVLNSFLHGQEAPLHFVNPFIGTGGHGHTFPGAVLPFGMVQLSPDTRIDGSWDGCGGYHYSDSIIYGFSHTHLSGTGVSDWGDVMLMPLSSNPSFDKTKYSSRFSHSTEKASAGYYEVVLADEEVKAELTTTLRTGIHRYTFPKNKQSSVILDLLHRDKLVKGSMKMIDSCTVIGYRVSEAWAKEQHCYFAIKFSRAIKRSSFERNGKSVETADTTIKNAGEKGLFYFPASTETLIVKVALSPVSMKGALNNLNTEAPHWDFDQYKKQAQQTWEKQLKKVSVKSTNTEQLTNFYTALYHCFIHPSLNMDCDNRYRGRDNKIHTAKNFTNYTVFSLWDTYRAAHPLFTILEQQRTRDFIQTFLEQYKVSGRLPVWELSGNETDCMIGYHSVSVIADAIAKKIGGIDTTLAIEAIKAASNYTGFGIPAYIEKGFLSVDDEPESVSKTLEYAYDDWCIAQIMKRSNRKQDYLTYINRAQGYKNVFDAQTGFMRPRKNGGWLSPFDPKEVNNYYTEGNSWQYSFYVPHDISGLIKLHGGEIPFEQKLDSLFTTGNKTTGRTQDDITGLIGQYAHGNEPSHHMIYLYDYVGKPHKTQQKVLQVMNDFYKNSPDGLIGNEDCGQMSAWYVFSALGFYPVCPGNPEYTVGYPLFDSVAIHLENGKNFIITRTSKKNADDVITSGSLNNRPYNRSVFSHAHIVNGGILSYTTGTNTSENKFGKGLINQPVTKITATPIIPSPLIMNGAKSFSGSQEIVVKSPGKKNDTIVYTLDGSAPTRSSQLYKENILIGNTCVLKAKAYNKDSSKISEAHFFKRPNNWQVELRSKYNKQYSAGGAEGIIDGIYGDENWRKGEWQGYQYQDFECTIDLMRETKIGSVIVDCLQDTRAWIIFPSRIEIFVSDDNITFTALEPITNTVPANDYTVQTKKFEKKFNPGNARYVRIIAHNFGTLPEWHDGRGDGAFIFVDEIEIK
jgi:predicted alpha-1,2-mannosidase